MLISDSMVKFWKEFGSIYSIIFPSKFKLFKEGKSLRKIVLIDFIWLKLNMMVSREFKLRNKSAGKVFNKLSPISTLFSFFNGLKTKGSMVVITL